MEQKFIEWFASLSKKYRQSQTKAVFNLNAQLISYYFELGKEIFKKQKNVIYNII